MDWLKLTISADSQPVWIRKSAVIAVYQNIGSTAVHVVGQFFVVKQSASDILKRLKAQAEDTPGSN